MSVTAGTQRGRQGKISTARGQALVIQFMQEDPLGMKEAKHFPPSPFMTLSTAACNSKIPMKDPRRCLLRRSASVTKPLQSTPMEMFISLFAFTDMRLVGGGSWLSSLEMYLVQDPLNQPLNPVGAGFHCPTWAGDLLCLSRGFICWTFCFLLLLFKVFPRLLLAAAMRSPSDSVLLPAKASHQSRGSHIDGHMQMRDRQCSPGLASRGKALMRQLCLIRNLHKDFLPEKHGTRPKEHILGLT